MIFLLEYLPNALFVVKLIQLLDASVHMTFEPMVV